MENILVIGNGFDIAHGFNTRYEDFINFCKTIATVYQGFKDNQFIYQNEYNDILKEKLDKVFKEKSVSAKAIKYFSNLTQHLKLLNLSKHVKKIIGLHMS